MNILTWSRDIVERLPPLQWRAIKRSRALINSEKRLMVIWSPKSACTTSYVWFASQSGLTSEMRETNAWPHVHRRTVYQKSDLYKTSLRYPLKDYRVVRIIRDPFSRTASIYRHALKNSYIDEYLPKLMSGRLTRASGFSFNQFLDLLESLDLDTSNPHMQPQLRAVEAIRSADFTINISKSDLFIELNQVERQIGLPVTNFAELDWLLQLEDRRKANGEVIEGSDVDQRPFNQRAAIGKAPFPTYAQLLTPSACQRIERLYSKDFQAFARFL